jgi:hypothetical protein
MSELRNDTIIQFEKFLIQIINNGELDKSRFPITLDILKLLNSEIDCDEKSIVYDTWKSFGVIICKQFTKLYSSWRKTGVVDNQLLWGLFFLICQGSFSELTMPTKWIRVETVRKTLLNSNEFTNLILKVMSNLHQTDYQDTESAKTFMRSIPGVSNPAIREYLDGALAWLYNQINHVILTMPPLREANPNALMDSYRPQMKSTLRCTFFDRDMVKRVRNATNPFKPSQFFTPSLMRVINPTPENQLQFELIAQMENSTSTHFAEPQFFVPGISPMTIGDFFDIGNCIIVARPGVGKTYILRKLCEILPQLDRRFAMMYIDARSFIASGYSSIYEYLKETLGLIADPEEKIRARFEKSAPTIFWAIDNIDKIPQHNRTQILGQFSKQSRIILAVNPMHVIDLYHLNSPSYPFEVVDLTYPDKVLGSFAKIIFGSSHHYSNIDEMRYKFGSWSYFPFGIKCIAIATLFSSIKYDPTILYTNTRHALVNREMQPWLSSGKFSPEEELLANQMTDFFMLFDPPSILLDSGIVIRAAGERMFTFVFPEVQRLYNSLVKINV